MPETRVVSRVHDGWGNVIEEITAEISDEQLAEEAEAEEIKLVIEQLNDKGINKAWKRLLKKGLLP